jgi:glutathione S-transferase
VSRKNHAAKEKGGRMTVVLYDLVGRDGRRFSPHCWRTRMALAHKGLECEARPTRFGEIGRIGDGQVRTVPAIEDGPRLIGDSWAIAQYLEATYPERPSLFGGAGGEAVTRFVQNWCAAVLHAGLVGMIVLDIWERLAPEDQVYFRTSREQRFGRTLEEVQAGREARLEGFRNGLQPLRMTLKDAPFLGGAQPLYADYLVFGALQWARVISPLQVLAADDLVHPWFERCLDLHGGLGRQQAGYW